MQAIENVHQTRWGYYPCSYVAFRILKAFHKVLFRDCQATRQHGRWAAKLPHNRVRRFKDGRRESIPEPRCLGTDRLTYQWVLAEYRKARYPKATPEEVEPLDLPSGWQARFDELRVFYGDAG